MDRGHHRYGSGASGRGTPYLPHALICALALSIAGCDGGIFGTGDGDIDADAPTVGDGMAPGTNDATGGGAIGSGELAPSADTGGDGDGQGGDTGSTDGSGTPQAPDADAGVPLENDVAGHADPSRLLGLVNLSNRSIMLHIDDDTVVATAGTPLAPLEIPADVSRIEVRTLDDDERLALFAPVELSPYTLTHLLLRPDGEAFASDVADVLPLSARAGAPGSSGALVRIVVASPLAGRPDGATVNSRLEPAPGGNGGVAGGDGGTLFVPSAFDRPPTGYESVASGDYRLLDDFGTFDVIAGDALSFEDGGAYTIYLVDAGEERTGAWLEEEVVR